MVVLRPDEELRELESLSLTIKSMFCKREKVPVSNVNQLLASPNTPLTPHTPCQPPMTHWQPEHPVAPLHFLGVPNALYTPCWCPDTTYTTATPQFPLKPYSPWYPKPLHPLPPQHPYSPWLSPDTTYSTATPMPPETPTPLDTHEPFTPLTISGHPASPWCYWSPNTLYIPCWPPDITYTTATPNAPWNPKPHGTLETQCPWGPCTPLHPCWPHATPYPRTGI